MATAQPETGYFDHRNTYVDSLEQVSAELDIPREKAAALRSLSSI
jgi:hypothetical protein